jgi:hypothetical protein
MLAWRILVEVLASLSMSVRSSGLAREPTTADHP